MPAPRMKHTSMEGAGKARPQRLPGATCFARAFFGFISPAVRMARQEGLSPSDVYEHTLRLDTKPLCDFFEKQWQEELKRASKRLYMPRALAAGRWGLLIGTGAGYLVSQVLSLVGPILLKQILHGLSCRHQRRNEPDVDVSGCEGGDLRLYLCVSRPVCVRAS